MLMKARQDYLKRDALLAKEAGLKETARSDAEEPITEEQIAAEMIVGQLVTADPVITITTEKHDEIEGIPGVNYGYVDRADDGIDGPLSSVEHESNLDVADEDEIDFSD